MASDKVATEKPHARPGKPNVSSSPCNVRYTTNIVAPAHIQHEYQVFSTLGEGRFAKVKDAIHRTTAQPVVLKILNKKELKSKHLQKVYQREGEILKNLSHKNIPKLYEIIETDDLYVLALEKANKGELFDFIIERGGLPECEAKVFVRQLVDAVYYIHSMGVVHRDIKPENILLDTCGNLKLVDFGLSNNFHKDGKLKTLCGSPTYSAPEVIMGRTYSGPEVDVWSIGINTYAFLTCTIPFYSDNMKTLLKQMFDNSYNIDPLWSMECRNFIERTIVVKPESRASMGELLMHPWIRGEECFTAPMEATSPQRNKKGMMDIDHDVIKSMEENLGISRQSSLKSIKAQQHDKLHATYELLKSTPTNSPASGVMVPEMNDKRQKGVNASSLTKAMETSMSSQVMSQKFLAPWDEDEHASKLTNALVQSRQSTKHNNKAKRSTAAASNNDNSMTVKALVNSCDRRKPFVPPPKHEGTKQILVKRAQVAPRTLGAADTTEKLKSVGGNPPSEKSRVGSGMRRVPEMPDIVPASTASLAGCMSSKTSIGARKP